MSMEIKANVIKRNGQEVPFEIEKIANAIRKANAEVDRLHQLNEYQIVAVSDKIAREIGAMPHAAGVEEIQDMVEKGIMEMRGYEVAQKYVRYRYKREIARKSNTTDNGILALINQVNEEVNQENSNKNPAINSTQRERILSSIPRSVTIWPARSPRISPAECCFLRISCAPTKKESFISMTQITSRRKSITVTWSTWRICCRTAR